MKKEVRKQYFEEVLVLDIAKSLPNVNARFSSSEEDCGYNKADVVLNHFGKDYYVQVSRHQKSKKQREKLLKRGTCFVYTHSFDNQVEYERIRKDLISILEH